MRLVTRSILGILSAILFLSGCSGSISPRPSVPTAILPEQRVLDAPTPVPTLTATPERLGSPANPIRIALVSSQQTQTQLDAGIQLAAQLGTRLGLQVEAVYFQNYPALETALIKNQVQLAWLQPVEYLLANQKNLMWVQLITNHHGVTAYGVQFLAHQESGFTPFFDPDQNISTVTAQQALAQFSGKRPCYSSDKSLAGYWVPNGLLVQSSVPTQDPVITHSYSGTIRALYTRGVCDFGVTYAISSDPRTSSEVITDLKDVLAVIPILWKSGPIIPNLNLSASPQIDLPTQTAISEFLNSLVRTQEGRNLLTTYLNYEVSGLLPFQDDEYHDLRSLLSIQNLRLNDLLPIP